jgi:hypothetical protein
VAVGPIQLLIAMSEHIFMALRRNLKTPWI